MSNETQVIYRRAATFERAAVDLEKRVAILSFSSETPVPRSFGVEVLDHSPSSVRMQRLNAGAPLLFGHDTSQQEKLLGVVERAWLSEDRRGHAEVRFSRSAEGERAMQDAHDGILRNVSVGYILHDTPKAERSADGVSTYRFRDWEPYEVSLLTVPADTSVGIGREFAPITEPVAKVEPETAKAEAKQERGMEQKVDNPAASAGVDLAKQERERASEIYAIRDAYGKFVTREQAAKFVADGATVEAVRKHVMDAQIADAQANEVKNLNPLGMSDKDERSYSILAALRSASGEKLSKTDGDFEREVSDAFVKTTGRSQREGSIVIPMNVKMRSADIDRALATRAGLDTKTTAAGGASVYTEFQGLIDLLRNKMVVRQLGATVLSGLSSNVSFVKQLTSSAATWVAENPGADVVDTALTLGNITLSPKILQASTAFSRNLLLQSSLDVEGLVRSDLMQVMALAMDLAALAGSGAANQPKGILNQTGIGSATSAGAALGTAGLLFDLVNELETLVAEANADTLGTGAYLTTPRLRKKARLTPELANTIALPVWQGKEMNGYRAEVTNQLPKPLSGGGTPYAQHTLLFGIWQQLMIGEWGALEVIADPYRLKKQGMIEITTYDSCDINVRLPQAFAAVTDLNPLA